MPLLPPGAELARPRERRPRGAPDLGEAAAGAHRRVVHQGRRDDGARRGTHLRDLPPRPPGTPRDPGAGDPARVLLLPALPHARGLDRVHAAQHGPRAAGRQGRGGRRRPVRRLSRGARVAGSARRGRRGPDRDRATLRRLPRGRRGRGILRRGDEPPAGGGAATRPGGGGVAAVLERRAALSPGGDHLRHLPRCPPRRAGRPLSAREPRGRRQRPVRRLPRRRGRGRGDPARPGEDPGDDLRTLPQRARCPGGRELAGGARRGGSRRRRSRGLLRRLPPLGGAAAGAVVAERFHPASLPAGAKGGKGSAASAATTRTAGIRPTRTTAAARRRGTPARSSWCARRPGRRLSAPAATRRRPPSRGRRTT